MTGKTGWDLKTVWNRRTDAMVIALAAVVAWAASAQPGHGQESQQAGAAVPTGAGQAADEVQATGARRAPAGVQALPEARAVVERAVDLVGGEEALRDVERVTLDMMTQWQRPSFREVPYRDRPSFEPHVDVRDYSIPAWRNTRHFTGDRQIVNVVRDSVALTDTGRGFEPLSVAYVDEREELFLYTPDRLLLALLDAPDLSAPGDTLIGGERHRRVRGTLAGRFPSTVYFHAGTGLPTLLRFRAGHPADFGLVPWGVMDVEVWYSNWSTFGDLGIPTQWDIVRQGEPYKRMTVRRAVFDPDFAAADSFAVSAELRDAYWASTAPLPMHEGRVRVEEARMIDPGLADLTPGFGIPTGAVAVGDGWMLLGAGQTPYNYDQGVTALRELGAAPVTAVLAANARTTNGGVRRAARDGLPIYVSPASEPFVRLMLDEAGLTGETVRVVREPTVLGSDDGRIILAPVDLPDVPGALMLYRPATGWLFVPDALRPLDARLAREQAGTHGWEVRSFGTERTLDG